MGFTGAPDSHWNSNTKIAAWEGERSGKKPPAGTGVALGSWGIKREVRERLQTFSRGEELLELLHTLPQAAGNVLEQHPPPFLFIQCLQMLLLKQKIGLEEITKGRF